jgi:predicted pyridoxine 5'-phosphate oxidase superfamily flavin-nucleotide-binding protein
MSAGDRSLLPAFHAGEVMLQQKAGLAERMAELGTRVVRRFMPEQHREFFPLLPYLIVGALDSEQQPWATILSGPTGFVDSPDPSSLRIAALPFANDPLAGQILPGAPIGLLGFQAHTRRRNRANGQIVVANRAGFALQVSESFGNCPKYIQAREARPTAIGPEGAKVHAASLNEAMQTLVAHADTFFIASAHPDAGRDTNAQSGYGVDISHRGGKPGFVKIETLEDGRNRLLVPDFVGNFFFNTFGNIALNPKVGLLFIDYAEHRLLHLAGRAELVLDGPEVDAYVGAERLLAITIDRAILRNNALPLDWSEAEISPFLEHTGQW